MAEGFRIQDLEKEVTCGICQELYTEPKVLPCLHYYCKECVFKLLRAARGKPFPCPECRSPATIEEGEVEKLKSAFFINRFQSHFSAMQRVQGKVQAVCEMCTSGAAAVSFCRQCTLFICHYCVEAHQKIKMYEGHKVASLQDLKDGRAKADIIVQESCFAKCAVHKEELKVYCFDCDLLICRDCTVKDHRDHDFEFSSVAAPQTKENLGKKLEPMRKVVGSLSVAVEEIKSIKHEIEAQGDSVCATIHTSFNEAFEILEKRKQDMLLEARKLVEEKVGKLTVQAKNLSLACAEVQSVIDYTERCISHCSDNEVMSASAEIKKRIEQEKKERDKTDENIEPVEIADIGVKVRISKDLHQLCQTEANIGILPDPAKCSINDDVAKTAEVDRLAQVTLTMKNRTNDKVSGNVSFVDSKLRSLRDGSIVDCTVTPTGSGQYCIQYTPNTRGRHELSVLVDDSHIIGSPFPVFVSIHPTLLGKPVDIWENISEPGGVAINAKGEVIVVKQKEDPIMFYKRGERTGTVKRTTLELIDNVVTSMSADAEGYLYLTSWFSNKILKLSADGTSIMKQHSSTTEGHRYSTISRDQLMVIEQNNVSVIMVYDLELNYIRKISGSDKVNLRALAISSTGDIFGTDIANNVIHKFSSDGNYVKSFGRDANGENHVNRPLSICVFGHFVYVCNRNSQNICVFTMEGEYVTKFGTHGSKDGEFNIPHDICADTDGYLYVCDLTNNRVQVF